MLAVTHARVCAHLSIPSSGSSSSPSPSSQKLLSLRVLNLTNSSFELSLSLSLSHTHTHTFQAHTFTSTWLLECSALLRASIVRWVGSLECVRRSSCRLARCSLNKCFLISGNINEKMRGPLKVIKASKRSELRQQYIPSPAVICF